MRDDISIMLHTTQVAYKGFDSNFRCMNDFQFEVGQKYVHNGTIELCRNGFHACINPSDVFSYYYHDTDRYAEVLVEDFTVGNDKLVSKIITIVREISRVEFCDMCNGKTNSYGTTYWYKNGKLHRDNDQPAVIYANGSRRWYVNGNLHRNNDKPVVFLANDSGCANFTPMGSDVAFRRYLY